MFFHFLFCASCAFWRPFPRRNLDLTADGADDTDEEKRIPIFYIREIRVIRG
jgi:hypothetical protein